MSRNYAREEEETRHFGIINSRSHMERNLWSRSAAHESEYHENRSKIRSLQRQLSVVRRKIDDFEVEFEDTHGYRPSQADKQNNKAVRKLLIQQTRLKRQIRHCRESGDSGILEDGPGSPVRSPMPNRPLSPPLTFGVFTTNNNDDQDEKNSNNSNNKNNLTVLRRVLNEVETKLQSDRRDTGRPAALDDMNPEQIVDEKNSIQNALSKVQDVFGHPSTEEERSLLRNLFQRYRSVKRMMRRSSNNIFLLKDSCELETIPEGTEIQLTLASPQHRINIEMNNSASGTTQEHPGGSLSSPSASTTPRREGKKDPDLILNSHLPNPEVPGVVENEGTELNLHGMSRYKLAFRQIWAQCK